MMDFEYDYFEYDYKLIDAFNNPGNFWTWPLDK